MTRQELRATPYGFPYRVGTTCHWSVWRAIVNVPEWTVFRERDGALEPIERDEYWYQAMLEHFLLERVGSAVPFGELHTRPPRKLEIARREYERQSRVRFSVPPLGKNLKGHFSEEYYPFPEHVI